MFDLNKVLEKVVELYDFCVVDVDFCECWILLEEDEVVICFFGKF